EVTESTSPFGMDHSFWDAFSAEMGEFIQKDPVLPKGSTFFTDCEGGVFIGNGVAGVGGGRFALFILTIELIILKFNFGFKFDSLLFFWRAPATGWLLVAEF